MSEVVKSVFVNYIFCAVTGGILHYIAPENSKKTLRAIIVSIILVSTFSPIIKNAVKLDLGLTEAPTQSTYEALLHNANLTEKKLRREIKEILINHNVDEYEIYITTSVDRAENIVYLDGIVVELGAEYKHLTEKIKSSISEEYHHILRVGVKNG